MGQQQNGVMRLVPLCFLLVYHALVLWETGSRVSFSQLVEQQAAPNERGLRGIGVVVLPRSCDGHTRGQKRRVPFSISLQTSCDCSGAAVAVSVHFFCFSWFRSSLAAMIA